MEKKSLFCPYDALILWARRAVALTGYDDRTRLESSEWMRRIIEMRGWRIASLKLELERDLNVTNSRQSQVNDNGL